MYLYLYFQYDGQGVVWLLMINIASIEIKVQLYQFVISMEENFEQRTPQSSLILNHKAKFNGKEYIVAEYERGRLIDRGGFSSVYEARQYSSGISVDDAGKIFAVKEMPLKSKISLQMFENQISILKLLKELSSSSYFVKMHDYWKEQKKYYIVLERFEMSTLFQLFQQSQKRKRPLPKQIIKYLVYSMLRALQMLHSLHIVHRDIKLQNVLLDRQLQVKLIDFGLAKKGDSKKENIALVRENDMKHGTPIFMAPQLMKKHDFFDEKVDVWAVGISLYYILYSKYPFTINSIQQLKEQKFKLIEQQISSKEIDFGDCLGRIHENSYEQLVQLTKMMLTRNKQQRISVGQILKRQDLWKDLRDVKNINKIKQRLYSQYLMYFSRRAVTLTKWRQDIKKQMLVLPLQYIDILKDQNKVRVIKAVHIRKFGFFVLLSNGKIYAYFNDHQIIKYQESSQLSLQKGSRSSKVNKNKQNILTYVKSKYFQQQLQKCQSKFNLKSQWFFRQYCLIYKMFFEKKTFYVRLNNQVLQLFFKKTDEEEQVLNRCIMLNHNKVNKNQILIIKGQTQFKYQNYQKAIQQPKSKQYVQYVKTILTLLLDNSKISYENYGYEKRKIQSI